MPSELDAGRLFARLVHHRLLLALAPSLRPHLQEADARELTDMEQRGLKGSLGRIGGMLQLLGSFKESAIPVLTFKGAAYGAQIMGDPVRRGGIDIDLLVPPKEGNRASDLLLSLGYRPAGPAEWKSQTFVSSAMPQVDLHTHIAAQAEVLSALHPFEHMTFVNIAGMQVPTLAPEDAIVYAAYHGIRHAWARLHWAFDLAVALDNPAVDWSKVSTRAHALRCERHLAAALGFAAATFNRRQPPGFVAMTPLTSAVRPVVEAHLAHLAQPPTERGMRETAPLRHLLVEMRLHRSWRERWQILSAHIAPAEEDLATLHLPAGLRFLYLPVKVLRILKRKHRLRRP
ncbi:nucleotidyltransferase family protein [Lacibacterium aquatile]|uniref:Nucleotidyltransferase family protein n=1 Tax=Lacibacterium aquatile TaxID=1168082 RepID=A0ABW5DV30_9PROT